MTSPAGSPGDGGTSAPIERGVLDALVEDVGDGDPALLVDLIDSYLAEASGQVADIEEAVSGGDAARVARVAHSLKSASASLGAMGLSGLLLEVETDAKRAAAGTGEASGLADLAAAVRAEYDRAAAALESLRPQV